MALGKIGDPSAIPQLLELAREDDAAIVRLNGIDALARLNNPRGREMLAQLAIDPAVLLAGIDRHFRVRSWRREKRENLRYESKWAAKRLRQLHTTEAVPILRASMGSVGWTQRLRLRRTIR